VDHVIPSLALGLIVLACNSFPYHVLALPHSLDRQEIDIPPSDRRYVNNMSSYTEITEPSSLESVTYSSDGNVQYTNLWLTSPFKERPELIVSLIY
jgi:hypothetical protein